VNGKHGQAHDAQAGHGIPIVSHYSTKLSADELNAVADLAVRIAVQEPNLSKVPPLDHLLGTGLQSAPNLLLEDHGEIQLTHSSGPQALRYRALLLAGEGDIMAVCGPRNSAFETYCREVLRLGNVEVLSPAPGDPNWPPAVACAKDSAFIKRVAELARSAGSLNVVPYMATVGLWWLASEIALRANVPVRVAAPPPRLARQVNDKTWFARRAAEALGKEAVPESIAVYGMAGLVGHLRRLASHSASVAVKLTHSAASRGNLVLDVGEASGLSPVGLRERLSQLMRDNGWPKEFPMQVTVWEAPIFASPSAQLWIPALGAGAPVVEGVFDQIVRGRVARFSGAVPSQLPVPWKERIASEALRLGTLFQKLGYFGRCSFDAVLVGHSAAEGLLHWVECNGRWTGVSIPMALANRLTGDWANGGFMVINCEQEGLNVHCAEEFLDRFDDALYRPGATSGGVILLDPDHREAGLGIDLLILGADAVDVQDRSRAILASLLQES